MTVIPFGEWLPDLPHFSNPGATIAQNVRPHFNSYRPFPDLGTAVSDALTARCRGAISVVGDDGNVYTFAGDRTTLNLLSAAAFSNVSISGNYDLAEDEGWEFDFFNNKVMAANISVQLQGFNVGTDTLFSNLVDGTLRPSARHIATIGRFVVIGNVEESSVSYPNRVRWSGIDDETDFDAAAATLSDTQDIEGDFGWIQKIIGGQQYGTIVCERGLFRMAFIGPPEVFSILPVEVDRGTIASNSVVAWGQHIYFLDSDGFYDWNGNVAVPISHGKVSQYFFDNYDSTFRHKISAAIDPVNSLVVWSFVSTAASGSDPDPERAIVYHWPSQRWGYVALGNHQLVFSALTPGLTLEQLDTINTSLDALAYSLDSRAYAGGVAQLAGFNSSNQMAFFDGSNLAATLETGRIQLRRGRRSQVQGFRPLVDGGTLTGSIAGTERLTDTETFGSVGNLQTNGMIPMKNKARYHKFRTLVAAAGSWDHAYGVEPRSRGAGSFGGT